MGPRDPHLSEGRGAALCERRPGWDKHRRASAEHPHALAPMDWRLVQQLQLRRRHRRGANLQGGSLPRLDPTAIRKPETPPDPRRPRGAAWRCVLGLAGAGDAAGGEERGALRRSGGSAEDLLGSHARWTRGGRCSGPHPVHLRCWPRDRGCLSHASVQGSLRQRGEDAGHPRPNQGGHPGACVHTQGADHQSGRDGGQGRRGTDLRLGRVGRRGSQGSGAREAHPHPLTRPWEDDRDSHREQRRPSEHAVGHHRGDGAEDGPLGAPHAGEGREA